jgi:hypothetical protein
VSDASGAVAATARSRWPPRLTALVLLCSTALLAPFVEPLVSGRIFVYNDLIWFHLPLRYIYQQALRSGDSLLWTPSIFSGFYFHGEGQAGVFHPLHQLLYRGLSLGTAFNLELIVSYVAAFAGMTWLLRRLRFTIVASTAGAMLFAFSGFNLLHYHHLNMVAVVAHLPWLLAAADVAILDDRPRARRLGIVAIAGLIASAVLIGFPQSVWWDALALAAFGLLRAAESGRWRGLGSCAVGVVIGGLIGGIQLVPTADAAAHSMRADATREFALMFSLHPLNLLQLWSPYGLADGAFSARDHMWFHEFGIHSGALLPIALIWVWSRRRALPARRTLITAATVFAAVMVVLALGRYGGLAGLLNYIPILGALRVPARYVVLAQFALTLLAAVAIDDLLAIVEGRAEAPAGPMRALWIPVGLGAATLVAFNSGASFADARVFAPAADAAPGVALFAMVTGLVFLAGRRVGWALAALIVLTAADLGVYGIGFVRGVPSSTIHRLIEAIPPAPASPAEAYAVAPESGPYRSNLLVLRGYRLTNGYAGLFPASAHPLDGPDTQALAGARWGFDVDGRRVSLTGGAPRIRVVDAHGQPASGRVLLALDRPGRLAAHVEVPERRTVALTERFHDGWTATANGVPLPVVRVNQDFLGVVVEPGSRLVELRFAPRSFVVGSMVSATGAVLGLALLAWAVRR